MENCFLLRMSPVLLAGASAIAITGLSGCGESYSTKLETLPGVPDLPSTSQPGPNTSVSISANTGGCRPTASCSVTDSTPQTQWPSTSGGQYSIDLAKTWTTTVPIDHLVRGLNVDATGIYMYQAKCLTPSIERWKVYSIQNGQNAWTQACDLLSPTTFSNDTYAGLAVDANHFYLGANVAYNGVGSNLLKFSRANCAANGQYSISGSGIYNPDAARQGLFNVGFDQGTLFFPENYGYSSPYYSTIKRYNPVTGTSLPFLKSGSLGAQTYSAYGGSNTNPFTVYEGATWALDQKNSILWKWSANGYPYAWADFPNKTYPDLANVLGIYTQDGKSLIIVTCAKCIDYTVERTLKFYYFDVSQF